MTEFKSAMSSAERAKRRTNIGASASAKVAKSEQLNFRLEEEAIVELQKLSHTKGLALGTMIREWVLERLAEEKLGSPHNVGAAILILSEVQNKLTRFFDDLEKQQKASSRLPTVSEDKSHNKDAYEHTLTQLQYRENFLLEQLEEIKHQRNQIKRSRKI